MPPVGHPFRYTVIAHAPRRILGPIADERLDALVERLPLGRGDHALEIGSGKGELLVRLLARWPEATAEGFDRTPWFNAAARAAAEAAGVADRLSILETDAPGPLVADRSVALTIAMGATGILGDAAQTVAGLAAATRPGGIVVYGDGIWIREPLAEGMNAFGMTRDELPEGPEGL
ncbi:MAG TPA: methyltransferase domain-containing protein, partial [Candidatus Saccharimonadales bacterium]|nr:methyltransferase domain-containing protein [Candidatus Saccharimonadales bacterium]